jgi:hypothetical protein
MSWTWPGPNVVGTAAGLLPRDGERGFARLHRLVLRGLRSPCRGEPSRLFVRTVDDLESFLLDQDVIYVGGGNTENMLAIWRVHGVDRALGRAWESGVVLTGLSAGSLCWFETGSTDSFGGLAPLSRGWVPGGQPFAALRRGGDATPALPPAGRRRDAAGGICRR